MRDRLALALLAPLALIAAACGSAPLEAHAPIFAEAPWRGPERLHYALSERDEPYGACIFETRPDVAPGVTELRRLCTDAGDGRYRDDGFARVDAVTLAPVSSRRVVVVDDERRFDTAYLPAEGRVRFDSRQTGAEGEPPREITAERELPAPTEAVPAPAWYDDEELFWLIRGTPLAEDYEGAYTNVNASAGRVFSVEVAVTGTERVEVPAGVFETWKVRIETSTVTHFLWVDREAPHHVVRAHLERVRYELTAVE